MCFWLEIRCADREERQDTGDVSVDCWSSSNEGCGQLCQETSEALIEAKIEMEHVARTSGWNRTQRGWVCPHCLEKT